LYIRLKHDALGRLKEEVVLGCKSNVLTMPQARRLRRVRRVARCKVLSFALARVSARHGQ
jgi:hypothetical protein